MSPLFTRPTQAATTRYALPDWTAPIQLPSFDLPKNGATEVTIDYGGAGSAVGTMAEFMTRTLALYNLRPAYAAGSSSGACVAIADALGADVDFRRHWVREMPTAQFLQERQTGPAAFVRGIKEGGFVDGPRIMADHTEAILADLGARQGRDVSTLAATHIDGRDTSGFSYRLQIAYQSNTQRGMQTRKFSPQEEAEMLKEAAKTVGIDVERNFLRLRFPRSVQVSLPAAAGALGFRDPGNIRIAELLAITTARIPWLKPVMALRIDTQDKEVRSDGATGLDILFNPDIRIRDMNFQRSPRTFTGPASCPTKYPAFGVRMVPRNQQRKGATLYPGDPAVKIPPMLMFELPSRTGALDFNLSREDLDRSMSYGGRMAEAMARNPSALINDYLAMHAELINAYLAAVADPSPASKRGWYATVYEAFRGQVAPVPQPATPNSRDFAQSTLTMA